MKTQFLKICSWFLVFALLMNIIPLQTLASTPSFDASENTESTPSISASSDVSADKTLPSADASILHEIVDKRTEFSKEYKLTNGMHMTVMYPEAVHYQKDGQWKDVDSTLKMTGTGDTAAYTNTADAWQVMLPQALSKDTSVSITADGYTISFQLAGEIKKLSNSSSATLRGQEGLDAGNDLQVADAQRSEGAVRQFDYSVQKAQSKHPETILEKLRSRLTYTEVYENTDLIYDLSAGRLKESVVLKAYNANLRGYQYILNTDGLFPVLNEDGSIDLYARGSEDPLFIMPAPYMIDNVGEMSFDVDVTLESKKGSYVLTYTLPIEWLASESRQWPVILDPVVTKQGRWDYVQDVTVYSQKTADYKVDTNQCGWRQGYGVMRSYVKFTELLPLSSTDIVVDAYIEMLSSITPEQAAVIEVHKVNSWWESSAIQWSNAPGYSSSIEDFAVVDAPGTYRWNITDIVREWYDTGVNTGMIFTAPAAVEQAATSNYVKFYSSDFDQDSGPTIYLVFRDSSGIENYWNYTTASAGRAGTGYVNNYTGNLIWVHNDIGFDGNLLPVSISHIYNSSEYNNNEYGLGYGWQTNYHQFVSRDEITSDSGWTSLNGSSEPQYYWQDGDGTKHYFNSNGESLVDEDGLNLTLSVSSDGYTITDANGNASHFDSLGRLVRITNNQAAVSSIHITYDGSSKRILRIADGAERSYHFVYTNNLLSEIYYTGVSLSGDDIPYMTFTYANNQLAGVAYKGPGGSNYSQISNFAYADAAPEENITHIMLQNVTDVQEYGIQYAYSPVAPHRVVGITEHDGAVIGNGLSIEYALNQTTFTDHNGRTEIMHFNDWGDVISIQDDLGRAQFMQYGLNRYDDSGVYEGTTVPKQEHQLTLSSRLQNTVVNLIRQSSFESSNIWTSITSDISSTRTTSQFYIGTKSLKMIRSAAGTASGLYAPSITVAPGESCTFSGYVKTGSSTNAYLALAVGETVVATSETLTGVTTWTRLEVSYTNPGTTSVSLRPQFMTTTSGSTFLDCVQLEKAPTASRHNLLENGDFSTTYSWSSSSGRTTLDDTAAPQLSSNVYRFVGNPTAAQSISQTVKINGAAGDTLILSGWAKGDSAPLTDENRAFGLRLTFNYTDGSTFAQTVNFNTSCDSQNSWQYVATPAVATQAYSSVTVELLYSYNVNTAYFDGIQLFKEEFGSRYYYNHNGEVERVVDLQKTSTSYTYASSGDLAEIQKNGEVETTYEYDDFYNVSRIITVGNDDDADRIVYEFTYDAWGNNTSTSMVWGNTRITTTATYSSDGNRLETTTDALANVTEYCYNQDTNELEWVEYPEDTAASRTEYDYDSMHRLTSVSKNVDSALQLYAEYSYVWDLLSCIDTNSTSYSFSYGSFDLIHSVSIEDRDLATYTYTNNRDRWLQELTYGNDDFVRYTYDDYGRVICETFEDDNTVTYTYDNTGALATVTDSETGIKTTYYYDFTDRLMKYVEKGTNYSHSVGYEYDTLNNLTKLVEAINGVGRSTSYTYDDDNRLIQENLAMDMSGVNDITTSYYYDMLGRIANIGVSYSGHGGICRNYYYKSTSSGHASTQIGTYQLDTPGAFFNFTLSYDGNGNITAISDGSNSYSYEYDAANQLLRENNSKVGKTWVWTYDNAGNILSRTEYAYTTGTLGAVLDTVVYSYDDSSWGDLLTSFDGKPITYDGIGNPLTYDGWTFTWEHGRELAAMSKAGVNWQFTYDANGMRTSRSRGAATYHYVYNGSKLMEMTKESDKLSFVYDSAGTPTMVVWNGTPYFFVTNVQGDVIKIMSLSGESVVNYEYDAWGKLLDATGSMATTLGALNPLRYRGYVYDQETGLYYLQSRYYNPEWGRFINADAFVSTGQGLLGNNMFAYCNNNPVNNSDALGCAPSAAFFPVCFDGASPIPGFIGSSDGDEKSELLLQYILDTKKITWYPFSGNTVYVSVQQNGIYKNEPVYWLDIALFAIGAGLAYIEPTPFAEALGFALMVEEGVGVLFNPFDPLPNREYYQYSVTMTWTTAESCCGATILRKHKIEQIYIWNDTHKNDTSWYLYGQTYTSQSTTYY